MYVIDVIPLSRTAPGTLSYRSRTELPVGSIVDVVLRKTKTQGIVISSTPVAEAKEMLKHAHFLLSSSSPSLSGMLPPALMDAAASVASYHASTTGVVIASLLSEYIRNGVGIPADELREGNGFSRTSIDAPLASRAAEYARICTDDASNGTATLIIVPTVAELQYWKKVFVKHKPLVLSGTIPAARRANALGAATAATGIVLATPSFAWTPIAQLGSIIIDRVSAGSHTLPKRPYLHIPYALEALARARKVPLTYGDFPLPLQFRNDAAQEDQDTPTNVHLVDARKDPDEQSSPDGRWTVFPEEVRTALSREVAAGGRAIVLATRSGYSPAVICRDCGQALHDERDMPLSFSMANGKRVFRSSDGVTELDARMKCPRCESWNLLPLGVGQERVLEALQSAFPTANIVEASADRLRSPASVRALLEEFHAPASIIVGGEALLPWLISADYPEGSMPLGVIASADSLLSMPFWRSRERFVRLSYFFSGLCTEVLLVSRHPEDAAVGAAIGTDGVRFWEEESSLRKALRYPPWGTIMTLSVQGSPETANRISGSLLEQLAAYHPSRLTSTVRSGVTQETLVLMLPEESWPDKDLLQLLQTLPPSVRVRINPESLW